MTMIYMRPLGDLSDERLLKRVRSASLAEATIMEDAPELIYKVAKRHSVSSPRAEMLSRAEPTGHQLAPERPMLTTESHVPWPNVKGCDNVRNAITFLRESRQHAMLLMLQNHWERAMGVLEKIEKATETVCLQRRKVVLQQANNFQRQNMPAILAAETTTSHRRCVRFSDDVQVAVAAPMAPAQDDVQPPLKEEMLVLRASRTIPRENYSEFWN